jgi:hypothetical protein
MKLLTGLLITLFSVNLLAAEAQTLTPEQLAKAKSGILTAVAQQKITRCLAIINILIRGQKQNSQTSCEEDFFKILRDKISNERWAGRYITKDPNAPGIELVEIAKDPFVLPPFELFKSFVHVTLTPDLKKITEILVYSEVGYGIGHINSGTVLEPILTPEYEVRKYVHEVHFEH